MKYFSNQFRQESERGGKKYDVRKYANLVKEPRVAMVIDNRLNSPADFHKAIAVTVTGRIQELRGVERKKFLKLYLLSKKIPSFSRLCKRISLRPFRDGSLRCDISELFVGTL